MPLSEELKTLAREGEPATMRDLFNENRERSDLEKAREALLSVLPQIKEEIIGEIANLLELNRIKATMPEIKEELLERLEVILEDDVAERVSRIVVRDGRDGKDGKDGINGKTPTKDELLNLVTSVQKKEKKIRVNDVEGLNDELNRISIKIPRLRNSGGGDTIIADDLSSQVNGSTMSFTTTKRIGKAILVASSQFPTILRLTTDFTASGMTLALDSALTPIQSGQTLYFVYAEG